MSWSVYGGIMLVGATKQGKGEIQHRQHGQGLEVSEGLMDVTINELYDG